MVLKRPVYVINPMDNQQNERYMSNDLLLIILSEFAMDERSRWFREPGGTEVKFTIKKI